LVVSNETPGSTSRRRSRSVTTVVRPRSIVRLALLLFATFMVVDALVGDQGFLAMRRASRQYNESTAELTRLRAENARRREEVNRLRDDLGAIEDAARRDLGFIRRGEKVFILKDLPSPAQQ
jgi:cell division protein FtsB